MTKANTGNGATATLANQDIVVGIRKITIGGKNIGTIDVTELDRIKGDPQQLIPGDIAEVDEVTVEGNWDTETALPKLGDVSDDVSATAGDGDVLTITWPLFPGQATAAKITGTGFFTGINFPEFENDAEQSGSMTWKFNGKTGPTYTAATVGGGGS